MWNPNQAHQDDDDDSWEIRAFAEDTKNIMGTTWPPKFYTCMFCRREFKSAQALGGHMNVHRRDRARFHHQIQFNSIQPIPSPTSTFGVPTAEIVYGNGGGGFCFVYQLPNDNGNFLNPVTSSACLYSPYPSNSSSFPSTKSPEELRGTSSASSSHGSPIESLLSIDDGDEKLDLELRLGHRPSPA